jgi:uncharacterized DUF497 family protein
MSDEIFLWSWRNREHLAKHGVDPAEARFVVENVQPPYPQWLGEKKFNVWGSTRSGRLLQVIFVTVPTEDVQAEEYAELERHERMAVAAGARGVRIIHARELTNNEKRRRKRYRRGRS